jgi:hypothetical protein
MRDVEAVETKPRSGGQQIADGGAGQGELQQVDRPIQVAQPLYIGFLLVHGRRQRRRNAFTNQAHQEGFGSVAHAHCSFDNDTHRSAFFGFPPGTQSLLFRRAV